MQFWQIITLSRPQCHVTPAASYAGQLTLLCVIDWALEVGGVCIALSMGVRIIRGFAPDPDAIFLDTARASCVNADSAGIIDSACWVNASCCFAVGIAPVVPAIFGSSLAIACCIALYAGLLSALSGYVPVSALLVHLSQLCFPPSEAQCESEKQTDKQFETQANKYCEKQTKRMRV